MQPPIKTFSLFMFWAFVLSCVLICEGLTQANHDTLNRVLSVFCSFSGAEWDRITQRAVADQLTRRCSKLSGSQLGAGTQTLWVLRFCVQASPSATAWCYCLAVHRCALSCMRAHTQTEPLTSRSQKEQALSVSFLTAWLLTLLPKYHKTGYNIYNYPHLH